MYVPGAIRETLHVGYVGQSSFVVASPHPTIEFACYIPISVSPVCIVSIAEITDQAKSPTKPSDTSGAGQPATAFGHMRRAL